MSGASNSTESTIVLEKFTRISKWDFGEIREYLSGRYGYAPERLLEMEIEYKKYISFVAGAKDGGKAPISTEIDPFWHAHILHTKNYLAMSKELGHEYIHHQPSPAGSSEALAPDYKNITLSQMSSIFGPLNKDYWSIDRQVCRRDCLPAM